MQISEILCIWRTKGPDEIRLSRDDWMKFCQQLADAMPQVDGEEDEALTARAIAGDVDAAFVLGTTGSRQGRESKDISMSWVLKAAMAGHPAGSLVMAKQLFDAAQLEMRFSSAELIDDDVEPSLHRGESRRYMRLAVQWARRVPSLPRGLYALLGPMGVEARSKKPKRSELPIGTPSIVPVREIGDVQSREGREMSRAYRKLLDPLPLAGGGLSPDLLHSTLMGEFPWLEAAIERIAGDLMLRQMTGIPWFGFRPILLEGDAGVGKTRFARRLAQVAQCGFSVLSLAGAADNRILAGTARGWSTAQPCYPLQSMMRSGTGNPVLVVDEVDKAGGSGRNGRTHDTLLSMLEPVTSSRFFDEALMAESDLSQVSWVLTANYLEWIPPPLLSRVTVIHVDKPEKQHFPSILTGIRRDIASDYKVSPDQLPQLGKRAERALSDAFESGKSVRKIKSAYIAALSKGQPVERRLH